MKQELVWVDYEDGETPYIGYKDEHAKYDKIVDGPEMTLEDLADFCDQNAESGNDHAFVGAHRILAAVLFREGRELATRVMRNIAEHGGLHGLTGFHSDSEAFAEFDITAPWNHWSLK